MKLWHPFMPKQVGKGREREKIKIIGPLRSDMTRNIKIIVPSSSNPTRNRKSKKNSKKIQRFKKYHYGFISSQNRLENDEKERK